MINDMMRGFLEGRKMAQQGGAPPNMEGQGGWMGQPVGMAPGPGMGMGGYQAPMGGQPQMPWPYPPEYYGGSVNPPVRKR